MTRPYQPSNGTEGEAFMERFCYRCKRDLEFQLDQNAEGCPIIVASMAFDPGEDGYPPEWIQDTGDGLSNPRCTAFVPIED